MNNLTMENNMSEAKKLLEENKHIIDKGEEIFRKFHSEFISDDWDSQDHCIRCNKFLHKYNVEIDLDEENRSTYHPDFTESVTGYLAMGTTCMKTLGIWKDAKAYMNLMKKHHKLEIKNGEA